MKTFPILASTGFLFRRAARPFPCKLLPVCFVPFALFHVFRPLTWSLSCQLFRAGPGQINITSKLLQVGSLFKLYSCTEQLIPKKNLLEFFLLIINKYTLDVFIPHYSVFTQQYKLKIPKWIINIKKSL